MQGYASVRKRQGRARQVPIVIDRSKWGKMIIKVTKKKKTPPEKWYGLTQGQGRHVHTLADRGQHFVQLWNPEGERHQSSATAILLQ